MRCNYPNCLTTAMFLPVIELPTIRTKGVVWPTKPEESMFRRQSNGKQSIAYLNACRIYDVLLAEANKRCDELSTSSKPTFMLLREVCTDHMAKYKFSDWFRESEWEYVREAAHSRDFDIPTIDLVVIQFKPLGWTPEAQYMNLER